MKTHYLHKTESTAPSLRVLTAWFCTFMVSGATLMFFVLALEVCTIFSDEIQRSPETWLLQFSMSGTWSWTGLLLSGLATWWSSRRYRDTKRAFDRIMVRNRRSFEGVLQRH